MKTLLCASIALAALTSPLAMAAPVNSLETSGSVQFHVKMQDANHRSVQVSTGPFHYQDESTKLDVAPIHLSSDKQRGSSGLWYGKSKINLESVRIIEGGNSVIIKGLSSSAHIVDHGPKLDTALKINFKSIADQNGPLGSAKVNMTFKALDTNAATKLGDIIEKAALEQPSQQQLMGMAFKALPIIQKLIDGSGLDSTFNITARDYPGVMTGQLHLQAPNKGSLLLSPEQYVRDATGSLDLTVDKKIIKDILFTTLNSKDKAAYPAQADKNLKEYVKLGWITPAGENYKAHFTLKGAKIFANGHPVYDLFPSANPPAQTAQK